MASASEPVRVYPPGYGHTPFDSDYRPWEADFPFLEAWRLVRDNTLLDQARLYELWELVEQAVKVPGDVLEVGTWRGGSAALIGLRLKHLSSEDRQLIVADTFEGVAKAGPRDPYYRGGEHGDTQLDIVESFLDNLSLRNLNIVAGIFPDESAHHVRADRIALCHIDVDVYESAKGVFDWVLPLLPPGGIVVFDDYGFYGCEGVTYLVHELRAHDGLTVVGNLNGHAVVVKT
ncbi:MAG: TylF/MycF family methyltransferase [Spirochaetales bacterium]|nr:TylF/MycF family methyltransferase [Spirochaetales bacterium]